MVNGDEPNAPFHKEAVPPCAAGTTLAYLYQSMEGYSYREVAINPTNPKNLASGWSASIVDDFREQNALTQLFSVTGEGTGKAMHFARPTRMESAKCLRCHGEPSSAPVAMRAIYGERSGLGWRMGDVIGAQIVSIPITVQARERNEGFLLRHDVRYTGKTSWCGAYYRWLATLNFGAGAAQTAFTEYWQAVKSADERVERLTKALQGCITGWRFEPVVGALQALRGVAAITAIGLVAEIGDLGRFAHPRKLMGYLGLTPSEHSSGDRVSRGSITKTGNAHARRLLTEAAWNYRFKARIGKQAQVRQQDLSEPIRVMAWKAQLRLTQRFSALNARGLQANKACVAIARELAGFVWAIGQQAQREEAAKH